MELYDEKLYWDRSGYLDEVAFYRHGIYFVSVTPQIEWAQQEVKMYSFRFYVADRLVSEPQYADVSEGLKQIRREIWCFAEYNTPCPC